MKREKEIFHLLHGRGVTVEALARKIFGGRSHLTQVLNGSRSGSQTRKKLLEGGLLTEREVAALGWPVSRATKFHVERAKPVMNGGCPPDCGHSEAEHRAFDRGVVEGERDGEEAMNPYCWKDEYLLADAWESGSSVGRMNQESQPIFEI